MLNSIFKKTVISIPTNWDKFVFVRLSNINLMEAGGAEEGGALGENIYVELGVRRHGRSKPCPVKNRIKSRTGLLVIAYGQ